jgi:hypothetical protein
LEEILQKNQEVEKDLDVTSVVGLGLQIVVHVHALMKELLA